MKRIVILGSSAAGAAMIEEVRRVDPSSEITLIAFDGHYPYKRDAFAPFIANEITPANVFYRPKDFYDRHHVRMVFDQKISRINFKRKKIFTEDKQQFDYDVLLVTDTPENRYPDIKGTNKESVYGYKKLKDIDRIVNALPVVKTVVVQSDSFSGLQAALSLIKRGKEVILVSSEKNIFNAHFEDGMAQWMIRQFEDKGLRIFQSNAIAEILGDKDAKAVRLRSGKVYSAETVLFVETNEDLRLFSGSAVRIGQRIEVTSGFRTDEADVFAVDQACSLSGPEPVTPLLLLEEQGKMVAAAMNGHDRPFSAPVCVWNQNAEGLAVTVLGCINGEGITVNRTFDSAAGTYRGLYIKDHCLVGAILINKEEEKEGLLEHIRNGSHWEPALEERSPEKIPADGCFVGDGRKENVSTELVDN